MCPGQQVDNCNFQICRKGRKLDRGENRSPTQISWRNLLPQPLILGLCVCSQSGADCDNANGMMAIVMMVMMIVLVMVIIVPETHRQVGWLCQC